MAAQKVYQIQINGLTESVKAVDALNESLKTLEASIKALEGATINVKASVPSSTSTSASGGGSKSASLSEEEKLQRQIEQLEEKRIAHSKEIYQNYLAAKDVLKETEQDQKQIAAAERIEADSYSNTIQGMKQELADIKSVMQTVDLGDTEQLDKMVKRANELNTELKKVEESYGQFGRNVGNYKSAADGFNKFKIEVGGVTREFNTAREAAKTLSNELLNLPKGAKGAEELRAALQQIKSEMQDINKSSASMDKLLDTMEGFVAVANLGQGIRGLFGVNDAEIQKSIKNLVALQNVLKGIETINKQINTREGIGAWIAPFNANIDKATAKLLTFNTALLGTGKAAKTASVAIKGFSKALKVAFSAGILIVLDLIVEGIMKLVDSFKKVDEAAETAKKVTESTAKAYGEASAKIAAYQVKVQSFNGTKAQEKKLVQELNRELGESLGTYKSLAQWQDVLIKKGALYAQMLAKQATVQAYSTAMAEAMANAEKARIDQNGVEWHKWRIIVDELNSKMERSINDLIKFQKDNQIGDFAPQIEKNGKKTENAVEKVQDELTKKEIDAMEDGLNKKLRQLDEEERQTINKLKQSGRKTGDEIAKVQKTYAELRLKEIKEYLYKLEETISKSANDIKNIQFSLNISDIDTQINELQNKFEELSNIAPKSEPFVSRLDINNVLAGTSGLTQQQLKAAYDYIEGLKNKTREVDQAFEDEFHDALSIVSSYGFQILNVNNNNLKKGEEFLLVSLKKRNYDLEQYYNKTIQDLVQNLNQQSELEKKRIKEQELQDRQAEFNRQSTLKSGLEKNKKEIEDSIKTIEEKYGEFQKSGVAEGAFYISDEKIRENYGALKVQLVEIQSQIEEATKQHKERLKQITKDANNAIKKNEIDTAKEISSTYERYFDLQISMFRDFQSKLNDEVSKNPVADKNWGVVNMAQTKRNYNEIIKASKDALEALKVHKLQLNFLYAKGFIDEGAYNATMNSLTDLENGIKNAQATTENASKHLVENFVQSINTYIQEAVNSFNQIMQAVWNAQDNAFDKEQEELDKELEVLENNLNKQEQLVSDYKSKVDSIEDELATSRGDRRQHLIDQLNAEMEAERAAYMEKQRLEKLEEANKRKQEELEKKRKKAQYHRDQIQAIVNGALAVTYASMNTWPIPAIPLMALAASTTAAQLAIMASNKPYAQGGQLDGGVAVGNRHRDGGIKVLGGRAEIEGGEFITNRLTTEKNINLLEYINSKKKRIDINDLVEFYSSGSVKKNIMKMSPKSKFADGGYIPPTLSTTIEIEDKLLDSFERYSNRPVVVSVVDITSKQDDVRRVQTLAGL